MAILAATGTLNGTQLTFVNFLDTFLYVRGTSKAFSEHQGF